MKKVVVFFLVGLFVVSFVSAFRANVTFVDDIGSFSGAILKIKSPDASVFGDDKIYASEYYTDVGIVKFEVETPLSEIDLNIQTSLDGEIVNEITEGPFVVNGSNIEINGRENVEGVEFVANESYGNESIEVVDVGNVFVVENESNGSILLTGKALFFDDDGSVNWFYSGVGLVVVMFLLVFAIFISRFGKTKKGVLGDNDKELKNMEKKVEETEEKIKKVKGDKEKKAKIYEAKLKLAEEEKELAELEGNGNKERVEEQEKVVDKAEDVVGRVKDSDGVQ